MPFMAEARIEQNNDLICFGIDARDIWPFMIVACQASQTKVVGQSAATVFAGKCDMVNLEWETVLGL